MRIVIAGEGKRALACARALASRKRRILVLTPEEAPADRPPPFTKWLTVDPRTAVLSPQASAEDLLVIVGSSASFVQSILENLKRQAPEADFVILSEDESLRQAFPDLVIRSDAEIYRNEIHEALRRISTRKRLEEMRRLAREHGRVLTLIWGNPDPDAIASSFALRDLLEGSYKEFTIAYMGQITRPENQMMVDCLQIPTVPFDPRMAEYPVALLTVDAQPTFFGGLGNIRFHVVIDHHPPSRPFDAQIVDLRRTYGSCSTILTEYYQYSRRPIPRRVATALLYGLQTDTDNLTRKVSEADIRAFQTLRSRADPNIIRQIELSQIPITVLDAFHTALASKKVAGDVVFSYIGSVPNGDLAVYTADLFVRVYGINAVITAARTASKLIVILRGTGVRYDVGKAAARILGSYGTAGGHRTMARGEIPLARLKESLPDLSDEAIERWLLCRFAAVFRPLAGALGSVRVVAAPTALP